MSTIGSISFWIDTLERSVRAFSGGVLTAFGLGVAGSHGLIGVSVPWPAALFAGGVYSGIAVLECLSSLAVPKADKDTGSFLAIPPYQMLRLRGWVNRRIR
jgi:hypothetical protein